MRGITLAELLVVIVVLVVLIALLLPVTRSAPGGSKRIHCTNNMKQISLALHNYNDAYGAFPPAHTVDAEGRPLHSWRTLLLPFLDELPLYERIDLSKPWDHPSNAYARDQRIRTYECPEQDCPKHHTKYLAVVAPQSFFQSVEPRKWSDVASDKSRTVMVIEASKSEAVHWMDPRDADEATFLALGPGSGLAHNGVILTGFADGSVRSLEADASTETRRGMIPITSAVR